MLLFVQSHWFWVAIDGSIAASLCLKAPWALLPCMTLAAHVPLSIIPSSCVKYLLPPTPLLNHWSILQECHGPTQIQAFDLGRVLMTTACLLQHLLFAISGPSPCAWFVTLSPMCPGLPSCVLGHDYLAPLGCFALSLVGFCLQMTLLGCLGMLPDPSPINLTCLAHTINSTYVPQRLYSYSSC